MLGTSLTLAIEGELTLAQFAEGVQQFNLLLQNLSQEIAQADDVVWELENLHHGSAIVVAEPRTSNPQTAIRLVEAYETIGNALEAAQPLPFSKQVVQPVQALMQLIGKGQLQAIRFATERQENIVYGPLEQHPQQPTKPLTAFGIVKGRVQSISNRQKPRFTLYDALFDKPVACYLDDDKADELAEIWDQRVMVQGYITRQPDNGRPVSVRQITHVQVIPPSQAGNYKKARGILVGISDDEPAEISLGRNRHE